MKTIITSFGYTLLLVAIGSGLARNASAADVQVGLSQRETYVGLPVTLQIQVNNASKVDPPTIPPTDGVEIKAVGSPARSTQITTINGRTTTRSSLTYRYEITPQRSGSFRIPPITVHADGQDQQTKTIDLIASKSETDDLAFAEIAGKEKEIYVGQSLDLTLKIWLRPYRDRERNLTLSEADMWRMISDRTNWGPFADRLQEIAEANQRPAGREVLRRDKAGVEHSYYLYEIDATIYPKRPGAIAANDVKVVVDYPTSLVKSRDPFGSIFDDMPFGRDGMFGDDGFFSPPGSRLTVKSVRPIVAEAAVESINVLPIPTDGRPADYRGAVGKYKIATKATPTNVKAGDPINLLIGISGTGPMELVQAPPLADLPELTADFKVPSEPLAGFVKDDRKVFSTTIRPRKEGVAHLPPIPFSYFDPAAKKFVTVHSEPISLHVEPADTLALDKVVQRNSVSGADQHMGNSAAPPAISPILTIASGDDVLRNEEPTRYRLTQLVPLLIVPPILVVGLAALKLRRRLSQNGGWIGSSTRRHSRQIELAEQPAEIATVLRSFLAKRFHLSHAAADDAETVGALRASGNRHLAVRYERLLQDCAGEDFGHQGQRHLKELKQGALTLLHELQAGERRPRPNPVTSHRTKKGQAAPRLQSTASAMLVAAAVIAASLANKQRVFATESASTSAPQAVASAPRELLTKEQQKQLLVEAGDYYNHAQSAAAKDSADAKQAFADAAEKYEVLIQSGVRNSQLFLNLGNAYLQSGQTGRAIASYRRSLQIDPTNGATAANLAYAENALKAPTPKNSATAEGAAVRTESVSALVSRTITWLNRYVSPGVMLTIMMLAWLALWAAVGLRILGIRLPWKSIASASFLLFAVAVASYMFSFQEASRNLAVVVASGAVLHEGDGPDFPALQQGQLREGQTVELCKRRGNWLQVRSGAGQIGWLPSTAAEAI
jgi:tetratricopeptide (TPR) repeat protein